MEAENIGDLDFKYQDYFLSAGRKASGGVYFEVPTNSENIEIEYKTIFGQVKSDFYC